jgi:ATP-binding protein involved in chromosome partitioning
MLTKDTVLHILGGVEDPELKKPLTELDMVRSIEITPDGVVALGITLTVPGCPMKEKIEQDVIAAVSLIPGVSRVTVTFDVMSDAQRAALRQKLGGGAVSPAGGRPPARVIGAADRFIAVASGKGGVGKSTITVNLACALARLGKRVGVLDADVYGFSIPRMIGVHGQPTVIDEMIVPLRKGDNLQVVSMGFFVHEDDPVIWRGPLLHKAIGQFLNDVMWRELDYLLLDLPPGTGDVTLTIGQAIPMAELLVVTTPQATAVHVAGRVAKLAEKTNLSVMGVIENMAYYETPTGRDYIFGRDGGKKLAEQLGVPLLGEVPLAQSIREGADNGKPVALDGTDEQIALFESIARSVDAIGA